jgi:hypothetical protein
VSAFESSLSKQPEAIEPLTQLIKSYLALKQSDKALGKLNEIIKQQPKNFVAYNLLGSVYLNDNILTSIKITFTDYFLALSKFSKLKNNTLTFFVDT